MVHPGDHLEEGFEYLGDLKVEAAVKYFEDITTDRPDHGLAWMYLGDSYLLEDDIAKAAHAHKTAREIDEAFGYPQVDVEVKNERASWEVRLNKDLLARVQYNNQLGVIFDRGDGHWVSPTFGGSKESVLIPPEATMKLGRTVCFLTLLQPMYPIISGIAFFSRRHFESMIKKEIEERKSILLNHQEDAHAWTNQGLDLEFIDHVEEAAFAYSNALKIDPMNYCAQRGIVKVIGRAKSGRRISDSAYMFIALDDLFSKLSQNPEYAKFRYGNDVLIKQNDILSIALRLFAYMDQKEAINPDDLTKKGQMYYDIADYPMAVLFYERALGLNSDDKATLEGLTSSLVGMRNLDKAEVYLKKLKRMEPISSDTFSKLGLCALKKGDLVEAEISFRNAIKLNQNDDFAWMNLTSVLIQLRMCNEARRMLDIVQNKCDPETWKRLQSSFQRICGNLD